MKKKKEEEKEVKKDEEKVVDETKDLLTLEEIREKINDPILYEAMLWYFGLSGTYDNHSKRNTPCMTLVDFNQKVEKYKDVKLSFRELKATLNPNRSFMVEGFWSKMGMIYEAKEQPDKPFMPLIEFKRRYAEYMQSPVF